jgi:streptomycin 6-kinase
MAPVDEWSLPERLVTATASAATASPTTGTGDGREAWILRLPALVSALAQRWGLRLEAPFQPGGQTAWVAPARDARGGEVVLKVGWRHPEAAHEADALREWGGRGAVELYGVEELDDTVALLLERCVPGTTLADRPEPEQDEVIAALLRRLWRPPSAGHRFRPLQVMCDEWADECDRRMGRAPQRFDLDPGLARAGLALLRGLPQTAPRPVLLCTDLHAENVLAAERAPWLVIDPKPYVGDPAYDVVQHMLNCDERLHTRPRDLARRLADLAGLDRDRVLLWFFARCVQETPQWPALAAVARLLAPA